MFSDGHANAGISKRDDLLAFVTEHFARGEVPVSTFGVGANFDELAMEAIADGTCGNHFYIDEPRMASTYVRAALHGLIGLVGKRGVLRVAGADNVVVDEIFGCDDLRKGMVRSV